MIPLLFIIVCKQIICSYYLEGRINKLTLEQQVNQQVGRVYNKLPKCAAKKCPTCCNHTNELPLVTREVSSNGKYVNLTIQFQGRVRVDENLTKLVTLQCLNIPSNCFSVTFVLV